MLYPEELQQRKRKIITMVVIIAIFVATIANPYIMSALATTSVGEVTEGPLNVRKGPGTSYPRQDQLVKGTRVTVLEDASDGSAKWYKIQYSLGGIEKTGYVHSSYIKIVEVPDTNASFEEQLNAQKFPESYKNYLRNLHKQYPNWKFEAFHTNLKWQDVLKGETTLVNRNLVPKNSLNSWKSLESGAYDWVNERWYEYEKGWVAASKDIIAYYMDPRNFLSDNTYILQFQKLSISPSETKEGVQAILKDTAMGKSPEDFAGYFIKAAEASGVSAYHLATRAIQETGGGTSGSVTGTYKNYYNIGAVGSNPVQAAVNYAKTKGWDTPEKSIIGGAQWIAKGYINKGQDSLYLQKFDVVNYKGDGYYWHQYMANVLAPASESRNLLKAYPNLGSMDMTFKIPVYLEMPNTNASKPTGDGNPSNMLKDLRVEGYSLTPGFEQDTYNYSIVVDRNVSSVNVIASALGSTAKVSGTGNRKLNASGVTKIVIKVTPGYGSAREYVINISKSNAGQKPEPEPPKPEEPKPEPAPSILLGDVNQDGKISIMDMVRLQKHLVKLEVLEGNNFKAADLNKDGKISIMDMVKLQKHLVGLELIK